jgi:hypothetical protein
MAMVSLTSVASSMWARKLPCVFDARCQRLVAPSPLAERGKGGEAFVAPLL